MRKLKWCIERTPENYEEVNQWANKQLLPARGYVCNDHYIHSEVVDRTSIVSKNKHPDFYEVDLSEFRLLTNPIDFFAYIESKGGMIEYDEYVRDEIKTTVFVENNPIISEPVFNELQRVWSEVMYDTSKVSVSINKSLPLSRIQTLNKRLKKLNKKIKAITKELDSISKETF